jgi:hypothetical protein
MDAPAERRAGDEAWAARRPGRGGVVSDSGDVIFWKTRHVLLIAIPLAREKRAATASIPRSLSHSPSARRYSRVGSGGAGRNIPHIRGGAAEINRRAVRCSVPYTVYGSYMTAFPAVTRTVLERCRGSYGTVLRLYGRRILRYRANSDGISGRN